MRDVWKVFEAGGFVKEEMEAFVKRESEEDRMKKQGDHTAQTQETCFHGVLCSLTSRIPRCQQRTIMAFIRYMELVIDCIVQSILRFAVMEFTAVGAAEGGPPMAPPPQWWRLQFGGLQSGGLHYGCTQIRMQLAPGLHTVVARGVRRR